jgi:hypothetical protein
MEVGSSAKRWYPPKTLNGVTYYQDLDMNFHRRENLVTSHHEKDLQNGNNLFQPSHTFPYDVVKLIQFTFQVEVFWVVTRSRVVVGYQRFTLPWRERQHGPPKLGILPQNYMRHNPEDLDLKTDRRESLITHILQFINKHTEETVFFCIRGILWCAFFTYIIGLN